MRVFKIRNLLLAVVFFCALKSNAQEITLYERVKIGRFKYDFVYSRMFAYEDNFQIISAYIKKGKKQQYIGPLITYRSHEEKILVRVDESLPPPITEINKFLGTVFTESYIEIDYDNKMIIVNQTSYYDEDKNIKLDTPRISKTYYKQRKDGFFERVE